MGWPDIINSAFQWGAAVFLLLNISRLKKDRDVRGISMVPVYFFLLWGFWNLYYFPHLEQWSSFVGGVAVLVVNLVWVGMALWYSRKER